MSFSWKGPYCKNIKILHIKHRRTIYMEFSSPLLPSAISPDHSRIFMYFNFCRDACIRGSTGHNHVASPPPPPPPPPKKKKKKKIFHGHLSNGSFAIFLRYINTLCNSLLYRITDLTIHLRQIYSTYLVTLSARPSAAIMHADHLKKNNVDIRYWIELTFFFSLSCNGHILFRSQCAKIHTQKSI